MTTHGEIDNALAQHLSQSKAALIEQVYGIITPADIKGFWIFDQTGASATVKDRGQAGHNAALSAADGTAINGNDVTSAYIGFSPTMLLNLNKMWSVPDSDDFSFGNGSADSAFSVVFLGQPRYLTSTTFAGKENAFSHDGHSDKEWRFWADSSTLITFSLFDDSTGGSIGRTYTSAIGADVGTMHLYVATYDGSGTAAGIKIYRDGERIDNANWGSGSYTAMENLTAVVGSYVGGSNGIRMWPLRAQAQVTMVVAQQLTQAQVSRLYAVFRGYAGQDF